MLNLPVMLAIVAVMLIMRWRKVGMLTWAIGWWVALYAFLKWGFAVPIPASVLQIYMGIVTGSILVYVSSSRERWEQATKPVLALILEPGKRHFWLYHPELHDVPASLRFLCTERGTKTVDLAEGLACWLEVELTGLREKGRLPEVIGFEERSRPLTRCGGENGTVDERESPVIKEVPDRVDHSSTYPQNRVLASRTDP